VPRRRLALLLAALLIAGCEALRGTAPAPTTGDFWALGAELTQRDVGVSDVVSGDAGCEDPTLAPTAIAFSASGLDQPQPVRLRVYIFLDGGAYERRRGDVDSCAASWATDPATFELVDAKPFVVAGQGPWGAAFKAAVREALVESAGLGG